ncbi:uncharacterized protein F4807DRAFT_468153 [Annulohypoxylon truncatum]|uniref:uncharacterized protein n=1 Tax=Annulohypoxylon truncatum TaxID=327061 RepID=UPI00200823E5|nr:uncharacterized protein F4807DRAFT_468153 [Annulohypoxylon truncatum]KAI1214223.1 hypothetical protein F4807DRAFT_468153 [Annulohypoxylon truncatum]
MSVSIIINSPLQLHILARKRKITPSAEQSLSKTTLVLATPSKGPSNISQSSTLFIQPFYGPKQMYPSGIATILNHYTHNHTPPAEKHENEELWHNRHVLIPYNLQEQSNNIITDGELCSLLHSIFPGTENVTEPCFRGYLIFQVKQLPSAPWPLTVGGLPITVSETRSGRGRALMFPRAMPGRLSISILQSGFDGTNMSDGGLRQLARDVNTYFQLNLPAVHIIELMFTCQHTFFIVIDDHAELKTGEWPGKIANYPVAYLHDKDLNRPAWIDKPDRRETEPHPSMEIADDTAYDVLRPGVMISSSIITGASHPATLSSTAGVLVKNTTGDSFMTAAFHAVGDSERVWQSRRPAETIGKVAVEIPFTGICLVKLERSISFSNQTFEINEGIVPQFTRLATSGDEFSFSTCYLNSPYTGLLDSVIIAKSIKIQAERTPHSIEERLRYVAYDWLYHGQEEGNIKAKLPDGMCGSVIWNDEGVIQGFYQFSIKEGSWKGFSACVSASEVVESGYTLVA